MHAAPGSFVSAAELLADFNEWLATTRGNQVGWSAELFARRLQDHESLPARFEKTKRRLLERLGYSPRPGCSANSPRGVVAGWLGVKFGVD